MVSHSILHAKTATAAAKNAELICKLGCKILIAEKAAEMQESHIVSVLSEKCQQMILLNIWRTCFCHSFRQRHRF